MVVGVNEEADGRERWTKGRKHSTVITDKWLVL